MPSTLIKLILGFAAAGPAWAMERPNVEIKRDSLRYLQDLRSENTKRLVEIDKSLHNRGEDRPSARQETEMATLKAAQQEHRLRQKFLDLLIFWIDTKFAGDDLRRFLGDALGDMATKVDTVSSSADVGLGKFMRNAAEAVHRLPERKENILSFLEGYMYRSISNPVRPDEFLAGRNYTNGSKNEEGSPLSREEAGAVADERLKEIKP